MSEVVNLSTSKHVPVEIGGVEYSVQLLTLGDYVKSDITKLLDKAQAKIQSGSIKAYLRTAADIVSKHSNIPQEVLFKLKPVQLDWILSLMHGVSPDKIEDEIRKNANQY